MMFNVDADTGDSVVGWLVPDNPNESPRFSASTPEFDQIEIDARIFRSDIVDLGMHNTGMVGFQVDEVNFPGLRDAADFELREATTRTLVYKRFNPSRQIAQRVIYFDASVVPQRAVFKSFKSRFAMSFEGVQNYPFETLNSIVRINYSKSLFISGRPHYMRYAAALKDQNFVVTALLRNPFDELAERLLFLSLLARSEAASELASYATGLLPLTEFASTFPFNTESLIDKAIRGIPKDKRQMLQDPLTRMLACNVDEPAKRIHVTQALDNLASMNAVGSYDRFPEFAAMVTGVVGANIFATNQLETFRMVKQLSEKLSMLSSVHDLLENDLALFSYAEEALDIGLSGTEEAPVI